jgi:hypothetical protein
MLSGVVRHGSGADPRLSVAETRCPLPNLVNRMRVTPQIGEARAAHGPERSPFESMGGHLVQITDIAVVREEATVPPERASR